MNGTNLNIQGAGVKPAVAPIANSSTAGAGSSVRKFCIIVLTLIAMCIPLTSQANVAGLVTFSAGNVVVLRESGNREGLFKGMSVFQGDTIQTGAQSLIQVRFIDGKYVSIKPDTQFRIDEYSFERDRETGLLSKLNKGFFSLLSGGFRTVTGLLGEDDEDNYRVKTPVATIGIRGTKYNAFLNSGLNFSVADGAIRVCNQQGCTDIREDEFGNITADDIRILIDAGMEIIASAELDSTLDSPTRNQDDDNFASAEVNDNGEPIALFGSSDSGPPDCSGQACTGAFGYVEGANTGAHTEAGINASFDGSDRLANYSDGTNTSPSLGWISDDPGDTTSELGGTNGDLAWGRWVNGSTGTATGYDAIHYVVGVPTPNITSLSGSRVLNARGWTTPTTPITPLGTFTGISNGVATINLGASPDIAIDFDVNFTNGSYIVRDAGALLVNTTDSSFSGISSDFNTTGTGVAAGCTPCDTTVSGFISGADADSVGLGYALFDTGQDGPITGAVVFD